MKPIVGAWRFEFRKMNVPRKPFRTFVNCFVCSTRQKLTKGDWKATFMVGQEIVGIACDECLSEPDRETLANLRRQQQQVKT